MNKFLKARIFEKFGTQADFAKHVKVDDTLVSKVIRGRRELDKEAQKKWSRALGVSREELFN